MKHTSLFWNTGYTIWNTSWNGVLHFFCVTKKPAKKHKKTIYILCNIKISNPIWKHNQYMYTFYVTIKATATFENKTGDKNKV